MKQNLRNFLCLLVCMGYFLNTTEAQGVVNFEDTWIEFLSDPKTASISELDEPDKRSQKPDYAKYSLMYCNNFFCKGEMSEAMKYARHVDEIGKDIYGAIPRFTEKYEELKTKMAAYRQVDGLWIKFQTGSEVSLSELKDAEEGRTVCEKGTLAKYFFLTSTAYYCKGNVTKSEKSFQPVLKLSKIKSFKMDKVGGLKSGISKMKKVFAVHTKLNPAWEKFIETDKSSGFEDDMPMMDCYTIPNMKIYMLRAAVDPCVNGSEMLKLIKELEEENSHPIPADLAKKIKWLEGQVAGVEENVAVLEKAWDDFLPDDELDGEIEFSFEYPCNKDALVKAYIMDGTINVCEKGAQRLKDIAKVIEEHNPSLDSETKEKHRNLKALVEDEEENLAALNKAWKDFLPDDKTSEKFGFIYCDPVAVIKAYTMDGTMYMCERGKKRLADIDKVKEKDSPELDSETEDKVKALQAAVQQSEADLADLNDAWSKFVPLDQDKTPEEGFPKKDTTLMSEIRLVEFYCDKIAQTKSWVIKGSVDACVEGETYIKKIDALKKKHSLKYDTELTCHVNRLRTKIWQCRYWELVLRARKETHEERERFGERSAAVMRGDLNTDKMECPTIVEYEPLGYIGVKYLIKPILCQRVNLAKMGDPEYYKKIASWVDTEVLQAYCEANMRCKEEFTIYIEGHTDGHRFSGRTYDKSLGIAEGTPFTHFLGKNGGIVDTLQKTTRAIDRKLENNMELGIARAWTVKGQLDFMKVPIDIGAYEHPSDEKDGDYRRIEIHLNIHKLLLDYYEKLLARLVKESGIGKRPPGC
ncbi:MAG: hypothetical protein GY810_06470 [Aureispira sp.]|nr:hypothetical protein [Aureispira sp.]